MALLLGLSDVGCILITMVSRGERFQDTVPFPSIRQPLVTVTFGKNSCIRQQGFMTVTQGKFSTPYNSIFRGKFGFSTSWAIPSVNKSRNGFKYCFCHILVVQQFNLIFLCRFGFLKYGTYSVEILM
jgi:hypothetical protein